MPSAGRGHREFPLSLYFGEGLGHDWHDAAQSRGEDRGKGAWVPNLGAFGSLIYRQMHICHLRR